MDRSRITGQRALHHRSLAQDATTDQRILHAFVACYNRGSWKFKLLLEVKWVFSDYKLVEGFLPILVIRIQDFMPSALTMPTLEAQSFACVLSILRSIDLVVIFFVNGKRRSRLQLIVSPPSNRSDQDALQMVLKKLFTIFPLNPNQPLKKVDNSYFVLNVIIPEVFFCLIDWLAPPSIFLDKFLVFIVDALSEKNIRVISSIHNDDGNPFRSNIKQAMRNSYFPNNSSATIPRRQNKRRAPNIVEPELRTIIEIAYNHTMEELLQAPTEGYGEAIVIPKINTDHFEIKTNLLQLVQANWDVPNDVIKLMMFPYFLDGNARVCDIFAKKIVALAPVKAVKESCVTYGGAHAYYNCLNTDSNQPSVCVATGTYNQIAPQNSASNDMASPGFASVQNGQNSDVAYEGPSIPTPKKIVEQETEETTDKEQSNFQGSTTHIQPKFHGCFNLDAKIASTIKSLLINKDKLFELAKIPLNENCSAILLKKLPEKLRDPGKFLIPCDFKGMDGSDFILEDIDAYLKDESVSLEIDHVDCHPEGDICLIEKLLNNDPFQLPSMDLKQGEVVKAKSSIEEPPN
uniref:Reverse transcriptase domain-containing protein n=1 Tax=Tanacetum cinerariifolium TaxID=118510 RepID=A0A6L2JS57_TANCI|nr:hypothetical protein [Tanacetum cinerariifolium]